MPRLSTSNVERLRERRERLAARMTESQRTLLRRFREGSVDMPVEDLREDLGADLFDNITLDASHKRLRRAYNETPQRWRRLVETTPAMTFKIQNVVIASGFDDLPIVPAGDEYTFDVLSDNKATYQVAKRGRILGLQMEAMANDELGAFGRNVGQFGRAAGRTLDKFIIGTQLNANPTVYDSNALVSAAHNNYVSSAALSRATLTTAIKLFREQTGEVSEVLDIRPDTLWVAPANEMTAKEILLSEKIVSGNTTASGDINPLRGTVTNIEVSPRISAASYFLTGAPTETPMFELGFFRGREEPEMFTEDGGEAAFNRDVMRWKVRHIYGGAWSAWTGVVGGGF